MDWSELADAIAKLNDDTAKHSAAKFDIDTRRMFIQDSICSAWGKLHPGCDADVEVDVTLRSSNNDGSLRITRVSFRNGITFQADDDIICLEVSDLAGYDIVSVASLFESTRDALGTVYAYFELSELNRARELIKRFNDADISKLVIHDEHGNRITIPDHFVQDWKFTGLGNIGILETGALEDGFRIGDDEPF